MSSRGGHHGIGAWRPRSKLVSSNPILLGASRGLVARVHRASHVRRRSGRLSGGGDWKCKNDHICALIPVHEQAYLFAERASNSRPVSE